jgi:cysteine desulfurase
MTNAMDVFGNPSSGHGPGQEASELVANARAQVANLIGSSPEEIVFAACGSEANNLAIKGVIGSCTDSCAHVITSQIEHASVLEACRHLERLGHQVTYVPVSTRGAVDPADVRSALRSNTRLISIMHANNETGVIQPIEQIAAIARTSGVLFHSDASQTVGKLPVDLASLPVDLLTLTGHKMYAPKGVAALFVQQGTQLQPLIHGGGQEAGRRAGTENVLGIVGLGAACAVDTCLDASRVRGLRDHLWQRLSAVGHIRLNGDLRHSMPGTLNVSFRFIKSTALVAALAFEGVAVSAGSACHEGGGRPSHVLQAMAVAPDWIDGAVRFSLGRSTTIEQIEYALSAVKRSVHRLRAMSTLKVSA